MYRYRNWFCNTNDTGACFCLEIQEIKIDEKNNFQRRYVNVAKQANSSKRMILFY